MSKFNRIKWFIESILFVSILILSSDVFSQVKSKEDSLKIKQIDTLLIGDRVKLIGLDSLEKPIKGVEEILVDGKMMITSFDSGRYELPNQILVVNNIAVDTTDFKLKDIKAQMRYPITLKEVLPWVGLGILIIAVILFIIWGIINIRNNRTVLGKPIHIDPPHIIALRTLEKLRQNKLWQNNKQKQYYTGITDALRYYIEGRYEISALEKTSNELLSDLENADLSKEDFEELKELFSIADLVKFAKYNATDAQNEKAIPTAVRFVNSTFMRTLEEESNNNISDIAKEEDIKEEVESSKGESNFAIEMQKKLEMSETKDKEEVKDE